MQYSLDGPPMPSNADKMAIVYLSNHTVNTLLYNLYENQALDFDFSKKSLPHSLSGYLDTSCKTLFCAGSLFPELAKQYPNSSLEVFMRLQRSPIAQIKEGVINVSGTANFTGYIANENFDYIFSGILQIYVDIIDFKLENYSLTGELKFNTVVLRDVESAVKGIDTSSLDIVVGFAVDEFLQPRLANFLTRGIRLPKAGPFRMADGAVHLHPDVIMLSTNFER